jgi:AcrR family transcriptional regulator
LCGYALETLASARATLTGSATEIPNAGEAIADRREELEVAAMRLFSEHPYEEVSVDYIAAQAGVAKGLLYYYFDSKRGLYARTLERLAGEMRQQILTATANRELEPIDLLHRAIDAHLGYVEQRGAAYRALISSVGAHPEVRAVLERERTFHRELLEERLPQEVPRGPALTVALKGWLHFLDGAVFAWLEEHALDRAQVCELCSRTLYGIVLASVRIQQDQASKPKETATEV